ncbi:MAG: flagellar biosynthetic protein FliR [Vicinamibacterales bacterium]
MDFSIAARLGLLLVRPGMLLAVAPGLGGTFLPTQAKIGLTVLIAIGLLPAVQMPAAIDGVTLVVVVAREAAVGLSLAFAVRALVAGAEFAGNLTGYSIGFSYGATIDPQSGVRNVVLATFYGLLATLGFLAINGHHAVLRALAASYQSIPLGGGGLNASIVASVREILGMVFVVAVRLSAPIIVALLIVEVAVGLISRSTPSLNFMVIGYPIRLVVGLALVAVLVPTVPGVINSLVEAAIEMSGRLALAFR